MVTAVTLLLFHLYLTIVCVCVYLIKQIRTLHERVMHTIHLVHTIHVHYDVTDIIDMYFSWPNLTKYGQMDFSPGNSQRIRWYKQTYSKFDARNSLAAFRMANTPIRSTSVIRVNIKYVFTKCQKTRGLFSFEIFPSMLERGEWGKWGRGVFVSIYLLELSR